jgi:hypothetical protein
LGEPHIANGWFWPILLKKSGMDPMAEKYASEIEFLNFSRGFRTQIPRTSVQRRCFHPSISEQFGKTGFFNTIVRLLPVDTQGARN